MDKIKIGRKYFDVKKGDFISYNGSAYLFHAGDQRTLYSVKYNRFTYIKIPDKDVNLIDFSSLTNDYSIIYGIDKNLWYI